MELAEKSRQVRAKLRRGVPDGELREELRQEGYSEADIKHIFKPAPYDMRSYYLGFAVAFTLIGIWLMLGNNAGQMLVGSGRLLLVFAGALYTAYFREVSRIKKEKEADQ